MIEQISPADLPTWFSSVAQDGSAVVLDVREPWEWETASVKAEGFTLVKMAMNDVPARLAELAPTQPIACLCHHGARSQRVAHFLAQNGFEQVVNIAGGIDAWSQMRDPSVPRY
jgi:rhodanese-related sulfurtransferase